MNPSDCVFCHLDRIPLEETDHMILLESKFPVTENAHFLIIPKRHLEQTSYLDPYEWLDTLRLIKKARSLCHNAHCFDFNVGYNEGEFAGQTVMHAHIHVIGRRKGDVKNPQGGIRNVIPKKGKYL